MDLDQDGQLDLLSGSYPGELYWFRGSGDGALEASVQLKDKTDEVINLGSAAAVFATDWDGDGDLDLVVGDISGHVWWMPNESGSKQLQLGEATKLEVDGAPIRVPGGDAGPAIADWDGDGTQDLIVGCGDGSVRFYANAAVKGTPELAAHADLVASSGGMGLKPGEVMRSGARVKVCITDWNGDGLQDLVTGDVLAVSAPAPELTAEQEEERERAQAKIQWVQERYQPAIRRVQAAAFAAIGFETENGGFDRKVWESLTDEQRGQYQTRMRELMQKDVEVSALSRLMQQAYRVMRPFRAQRKIHGHVWLWLRKAP